MQRNGANNPAKLLQMLDLELNKQSRTWKPLLYAKSDKMKTNITAEDRDETVKWLAQLNKKFKLHPESLALSVTILDRFLHTVKAQTRHLSVIGVCCFYLAAKTLEENEMIPDTLQLVHESMCGCSVSEILRMEKVILDKLSWNLLVSTPLHFLQIFHAFTMAKNPSLLDFVPNVTPSRQLTMLTEKLKRCFTDHNLLVYRPATLAAALVDLELEYFSSENTMVIQKLAKIDGTALLQCRKDVTRCLAVGRKANFAYVYCSKPNVRSLKRKMAEALISSDEEENIYEGMKRLFCMDEDKPLKSTCSQEMHKGSFHKAVYQAVAN